MVLVLCALSALQNYLIGGWEVPVALPELAGVMELEKAMKLETKVFELYSLKYKSVTELAQAMGISMGQVYRVQQGKRGIHGKFIVGAIKAFPEYSLNDLFYVAKEGVISSQ